MVATFANCEHIWSLESNAASMATFSRGNSLVTCKGCNQTITLEEKCTLEQTEIVKQFFQSQKESSLEQIKIAKDSFETQKKSSEEQSEAQKKSLKIQEDSLNVAKKATIISAVMMIIGVIGLYLERIFR